MSRDRSPKLSISQQVSKRDSGRTHKGTRRQEPPAKTVRTPRLYCSPDCVSECPQKLSASDVGLRDR